MDLVQEKDYEVVRTEEKVLVFAIEKKAGLPKGAQLLYDGAEHALLLRNLEEDFKVAPALKSGRKNLIEQNVKSAVIIDFLPQEIREELKASKYAIIIEVNKEKNHVARTYQAPLILVSEVPFLENIESQS